MAIMRHNSAALLAPLLAALPTLAPPSVSAQSILDGVYTPIFDEDVVERLPGPEQGEYMGLPISEAGRQVARTYDAGELTLQDWQCRPHPSFFGIRELGQVRIWQELDPQTLQQVALRTHIVSAWRDIWMDGRPAPPPWAPHTWSGYSVGRWEGDVLRVHTDRYKAAYLRRNGVPTSDQMTFDEYFFRNGDYLTHIGIISDPQYLTEPLVRSTQFEVTKNAPQFFEFGCRPLTEVVRERGDIPMYLPNQTAQLDEWAVKNQVPLQAAQGGAETLLPEYQDTMKKLPPNPSLQAIMDLQRKQEDRD